jgi:hypothetical protein
VESLNQPRDNVPSPRSTSLIVEEEELDLMVATKSDPPPGRVSSQRVWSLGRQAGKQPRHYYFRSRSSSANCYTTRKRRGVELRNSCYEIAKSPPQKTLKKNPKKTRERHREREESVQQVMHRQNHRNQINHTPITQPKNKTKISSNVKGIAV